MPNASPARPSATVAFLRCLALAFISLVAVSAMLWAMVPRLSTYGVAGDERGPVELPWTFERQGDGNLLTVHLEVGWLTPTRWQVIPDDDLKAIRVNGHDVPLGDVRPGGLTDYTDGFFIDLGQWLVKGDNEIVFTLTNGSGGGGLDFRPAHGLLAWSLVGAGLLPLLFGLAGLFRLRASQTLILVAGLVLLCCYWAVTPWAARTHDAGYGGGHMGYVVWVASKLSLPNPMEGWTYYHPPLYYLLGAAIWRWAEALHAPGPESLQALSLALWLLFLAASAGTLRLALRQRPGLLALATLGLVFWPVGIMHAIRIGNDSALYAACAVATWFAIRWWRARRRADLWGMAITCALSLLCKSNAVVLVAGFGLAIASGLLHRRAPARWQALRDCVVFGLVTGAGLAASFAVRVWYYLHGAIPDWLIANTDALDGGMRVPVQLKYFLPLDIPTFLTSPWLSPYDDQTGRANFWNYLLRSALSGEFGFPGRLQEVIAYLWGALLLALLIASLAAMARGLRARTLYRQLPWVLATLLWIASLLALRIKVPYACSNDFRYIVPVLVPAVLFWVSAGRATRWLLAAMCATSAVFFLGL